MPPMTQDELQGSYPDLLPDPTDAGSMRLVRDLDFALSSQELPPQLQGFVPTTITASPPVKHSLWRLPQFRLVAAYVGALSVIILALSTVTVARTAVHSSPSVTDLGTPTNDLASPQPLTGEFRHTGPFLRQGKKPEILFLGTAIDSQSAAERWPLVKALEQFGILSGVATYTLPLCRYNVTASGEVTQCFNPSLYPQATPLASYALERATYRSRYVTLVYKDLIDPSARISHALTPTERALFARYVRIPERDIPSGDHNRTFDHLIWLTVGNYGTGVLNRGFPLVSVGGYLQTYAGVAIFGDLQRTTGGGLPFTDVQQSMTKDKPVGKAAYNLPHDFNAETNILIALICHADHNRPGGVCGRAVITKILRRVK